MLLCRVFEPLNLIDTVNTLLFIIHFITAHHSVSLLLSNLETTGHSQSVVIQQKQTETWTTGVSFIYSRLCKMNS